MDWKCLALPALLALPAPANAVTIDFSGYHPDLLDQRIRDDEGDLPPILDVTSQTRAYFGNSTVVSFDLGWAATGYGLLSGVAIPGSPLSVGEFIFDPAPGYAVRLSSFELATRPGGAPREGMASIYDAAWNLLWTTGPTTISGPRTFYLPEVTTNGTLYLQWGEGRDIGIDSITFFVAEVAPVPLPAGLPLLLAALGGLWIVARRPRG